MSNKLSIAALATIAVIALAPISFADQAGGTAEEARAMLDKAVAAVKADKAKAIELFDLGDRGFRDRDRRACQNWS